MRNVRVFFEKKDMAKYISHLDLMRCFERAVKRAEIAIWYTEGYNPHAFMTFSFPLSLGVESYCELVDMRLTDETSDEEVAERLNAMLPDGIRIVRVAQPVHKAEEIAFARFEITLNTLKNEKVADAVSKALAGDCIAAQKKAKQGRKKILKEINLKDNIKSADVRTLNDAVLLTVVLTAGSSDNINPSLLVNAVIKDADEYVESVDIVKIKMYLSDMSEFE